MGQHLAGVLRQQNQKLERLGRAFEHRPATLDPVRIDLKPQPIVDMSSLRGIVLQSAGQCLQHRIADGIARTAHPGGRER